jgi:Peptidase family M41
MTDTDNVVTIDEATITARQKLLDEARRQLKEDFVGIDGVIDELCSYVRIWFLMPEILNRPVIVNLWGMTGVGKTDLVRKLVKYLGFQDRFCEVELGGDGYNTTVAGFLSAGGIDKGEPAIVLFDEIQRFATRNPDGTDKDNGGKFADFWELLSDGRLAKRDRSSINYLMKDRLEQMRYDRAFKERHPVAQTPEEAAAAAAAPPEEIGIWDARQIISVTGLKADPAEVAKWTYQELEAYLKKFSQSKVAYEPVDHSRTLCIVSGNLDEAFSMATQAGEADIDADIFSAYTAKITVVDIKNALMSRFRPEQVARFGNIHLIYRSLRKRDFEELIEREINRVIARAQRLASMTVQVDRSVRDLIYRNGVFPVQGVRPVFSSVIDILETNLTGFMFEAILHKHSSIAITYSESRRELIAGLSGNAAGAKPATKAAAKGAKAVAKKSSGMTITLPYTGRIDTIRQGNLADVVANVAGHEAGHAVVYCALYGLVPLQLTAKVASSYAAGFTFPHQIHETRDNLIAKAKILLAGGLAEDLLFGEGNATVGRLSDREQATITVSDIIRRYGFDDEFQANYSLNDPYNLDRSVTDPDIEKMISRLQAETRELLRDHMAFLIDLSDALQHAGALKADAIGVIAQAHGVDAHVKPEGHLHVVNYDTIMPRPTTKRRATKAAGRRPA